jgi:nitrogen fixation/metabolism regulation signal transduction histidine kinase
MEPWLQLFASANFSRSADTAHDLKTPLNVAVLNLELLRMRIRKLIEEDEKSAAYAASIELELRRMASIFDAFFLLSTPPKGEGAPVPIDLRPLCTAAADTAGLELTISEPFLGRAHQSRIRQLFKLFFEGASSVLAPEGRVAQAGMDGGRFVLRITGRPAAEELELTKLFKFYYTDPQGHPDLSLATARLIAETYGGELIASGESDKVSLRLSFPPGEE